MKNILAYARQLTLLLIATGLPFFLRATTFYFSSSTGDDNRSALEAQQQSTPWRSLAQLNSIGYQLSPGDSILLKRNDIFIGRIVLSVSGTAAAPIVIAGYGTGSDPLITGFTTLTGWTTTGDDHWVTDMYTGPGGINLLLLQGMPQCKGRYPNKDEGDGGYRKITTAIGNTSVTDAQLAAIPDWSGAEIVIRKNHWVLDRNENVQHAGNTISYSSASGYPASPGFGYFIQNHPATLDRTGEWYYSRNEHRLGIKSPGDPATKVQVSIVPSLLSINSQRYLRIIGLHFSGSNENAIAIEGGTDIQLSDCQVSFAGINGIVARNTDGLHVENSRIEYCNNIALSISGNNNIIEGNNIANTGTFAGMGEGDSGSYEAVMISGDHNRIERNTIKNTGYIPITFNGNSVIVSNNFIDTFATIKDDGGGIYTWNNGSGATMNSERTVTGNIILHGTGALAGTPDAEPMVHGIYIDDNSDHVTVTGNTIAYTGRYGIFIHNARDIIVTNNTLYDNGKQLVIEHDQIAPNSLVRNITNRNNILFSKLASQAAAEYKTVDNDLAEFGSFDSNFYCRPIDTQLIIITASQNNGVYSSAPINLSGWQAMHHQDLASRTAPARLLPYRVTGAIGLNQYSNGQFNSNITGIYAYAAAGNCVTSWSNNAGLDGGALKISFSSTTPNPGPASVIIGIGAISSSKTYILRFSIRCTNESKLAATFLRKSLSPYNDLSKRQYMIIENLRSNAEYLIVPSVSESNASLVFDIPEQTGAVYIDNIELREAEVTITNPDDSLLFAYNATATVKPVALGKTYIDAKGQLFSGTISLAPFSSIVLLQKEAIVLPVYFTNFQAKKIRAGVQLNWRVGTDEAIKHFEVQRSGSSMQFTNIGITEHADGVSAYSFTDPHPISGANYYRVKAITANGNIVYTEVVNIMYGSGANAHTQGILAYPTVATHTVMITIQAPSLDPNAVLIIRSVDGKIVKLIATPGRQQSVDVSSFAENSYIVSYLSAEYRIHTKFIKQ